MDARDDAAVDVSELVDGLDAIVWEGDAQTFRFSYVSRGAEKILGYPVEDWLRPGFWAETIVHPDDRDDAVAYCALATGQGRDHTFEYRAVAADGRVVWLRDIVRVVLGERGVPSRLRGLMIDVTAEKAAEGAPAVGLRA